MAGAPFESSERVLDDVRMLLSLTESGSRSALKAPSWKQDDAKRTLQVNAQTPLSAVQGKHTTEKDKEKRSNECTLVKGKEKQANALTRVSNDIHDILRSTSVRDTNAGIVMDALLQKVSLRSGQSCSAGTSADKNLRRRVYDVLNVFVGLGMVRRGRKNIHFSRKQAQSKDVSENVPSGCTDTSRESSDSVSKQATQHHRLETKLNEVRTRCEQKKATLERLRQHYKLMQLLFDRNRVVSTLSNRFMIHSSAKGDSKPPMRKRRRVTSVVLDSGLVPCPFLLLSVPKGRVDCRFERAGTRVDISLSGGPRSDSTGESQELIMYNDFDVINMMPQSRLSVCEEV